MNRRNWLKWLGVAPVVMPMGYSIMQSAVRNESTESDSVEDIGEEWAGACTCVSFSSSVGQIKFIYRA